MENKGLDTYKKVNDVVVNFMKEREVSCEESISQCDNVIEGAYELLEKLFCLTKDQFLVKCSSCGEEYLATDLTKCEHCFGKFCENCAEDLELEDEICCECKESLI